MNLNREKLKELTKMPDNELWAFIVNLAAKNGIALPKQTPPHSEMDKIRNIASADGRINTLEAARLLNKYKTR